MPQGRNSIYDYSLFYKFRTGRAAFIETIDNRRLDNEGTPTLRTPTRFFSFPYIHRMGALGMSLDEFNQLSGNNRNGFPQFPPNKRIAGAPNSLVFISRKDSLEIDFTHDDPSVTNYEYWIEDASGGQWIALDPPDAEPPIIIPGLINGETYNIRVRPVSGGVPGTPTDIISVPLATAPTLPSSVSVTSGNGSVNINITSNDDFSGGAPITKLLYSLDGITYYELIFNSSFNPLTINGLLTGLVNGQQYSIYLKLVNSVNENSIDETSPLGPYIVTPATFPLGPESPTASIGDKLISVSFNQPFNGGDPIIRYEYSTSTSEPYNFTYLPVVGNLNPDINTPTSVNITELINGTEYTIRLRAVNDVGPGPIIGPFTLIPGRVPLEPTVNAIGGIGSAQITVTGLNGGYEILNYKYTLDDGETFLYFINPPESATTPIGNTFTITGLVSGNYRIKVISINSIGESIPSDDVNFITGNPPGQPAITVSVGLDSATVTITPSSEGGSVSNYKYEYSRSNDFEIINGSGTLLSTQTQFTMNGLISNSFYYIRVWAENSFGTSLISTTSFKTPSPPSAPRNLSASKEDQKTTISFSPPDSDGGTPITNYQYSIDREASFVDFTPEPGLSVTITGLTNGTLYPISIRAVNAVGAGLSSSIDVTPSTVPSQPKNLSSSYNSQEVTISFSPPDSDGGLPITKYQYSINGLLPFVDFIPVDGQLSFTITGLTNGTEYTVALWAVNDNGAGTSAEVTATPSTVPEKPIGLSASLNNNEITISFAPLNNGGSAITKCEYMYTFTDASGTEIVIERSFNKDNTSVTISELEYGTEYTIKLRAENINGFGEYSDTIQATPSTVPVQIIEPITTSSGNQQIIITFNQPFNGGKPITGYKYKYTIDNIIIKEDSIGVATPPPNTGVQTSITITGLTNGTEYKFYISAVNENGSGEYSEPITGTPATVPSAPENATAKEGDGEITISFTSISNGGSPILYYQYSKDNGESYTQVTPPSDDSLNPTIETTTSVIISGLENGKEYKIRLRAVNKIGYGPSTDELTATPATTPGEPSFTAEGGDGTISISYNISSQNTGGVPLDELNYEYSTTQDFTPGTFESKTKDFSTS